jgi:hypothetical protein
VKVKPKMMRSKASG